MNNCDYNFLLPTGSCAAPNIPNAEVFVNSRKAPLIIEHGEKLDVVCGEGLAPNNNRQPICNNGTWSSLPTCVQGELKHIAVGHARAEFPTHERINGPTMHNS